MKLESFSKRYLKIAGDSIRKKKEGVPKGPLLSLYYISLGDLKPFCPPRAATGNSTNDQDYCKQCKQ